MLPAQTTSGSTRIALVVGNSAYQHVSPLTNPVNDAAAVDRYNRLAEARKPSSADRARFQSSINSYIGILRHYATVRLRRVMLERLSRWWWRYFAPMYGAGRKTSRGWPCLRRSPPASAWRRSVSRDKKRGAAG
ncbi:MAG: hypothetical protein WD492_15400 [Alkalispirochaeta sp.]